MKKQYSKFLRILITSILYIGYFSISSSLAQISEGGLPPSFQFAGSLRSEKLAEQVPVNFSVEDLKTVDAWRVSQGAPLRVAKSIPTSFDIADSGDFTTRRQPSMATSPSSERSDRLDPVLLRFLYTQRCPVIPV